MKQSIIFDGQECGEVDPPTVKTNNVSDSNAAAAVMFLKDTKPSMQSTDCDDMIFFLEDDPFAFPPDCPVCDACVKSDPKGIIYSKRVPKKGSAEEEAMKSEQKMKVTVYAELKDSVSEECFLKLKIEGESKLGELYLKVLAGQATTTTATLHLSPGTWTLKANVKEDSDS